MRGRVPLALVAKSLWLLAGHNYSSAVKVSRTALIVLAVSVVLAMAIRGTLSAKRRDEDSIGFVLWVAATVLFTPIVWPHRTLGPVLRATATEPSLCYVCLRSKMPRDLPAQM